MREQARSPAPSGNARAGDAPLKGIVFLVVGLSLFSAQDVVIKHLSEGYSVLQIVFVRGLVALLPILLLIAWEGGRSAFKTRRPLMNVLRGLLSFASYTAYYLALAALPLAEVVTLFYSCPLFVTALAGPVLAEKVGVRRWIAVLIGFLGVLAVLRPGSGAVDPAAALAILGALFYAGSILIARHIGKSESGSTMAFYAMCTYVVASGALGLAIGDGRFDDAAHVSTHFLLRAWAWPDVTGFGLMALCGVIAGIGFYCLTQAYRLGPASVVTPFEYSSLPWAILWGFIFWQEVPSGATVVGILLIVGGGLYIVRREAVRGRRMITGRSLRKI